MSFKAGLGAVALLLAVAFSTIGAAQDQPPRFGQMAKFQLALPRAPVPEMAFVDRDGREMSLADFNGKLVLLNFWATWCGPCVKEMPSLQRLQAEMESDRFQVLALSVDRGGLDAVSRFVADLGLERLPIAVDRTMRSMRAIGSRVLPTTLLIDGEGREIGRLEGAADWDSADVIALLSWFLRPDQPRGFGGGLRAALP
jgi:thiol-disulfide isomerase/thioredoxin